MKRVTLISLLTFLACLSSYASEWVVNKDHSEVFFSVPYLNISEVTGRFSDFKGSAILDEKSRQITHLDLIIMANTLTTENKLRDGHLKAPDFLNTHKYPEITFVSKTILSSDHIHFSVQGDLTLHGKSLPQTIKFELTNSQKDSWGYDNRFVKFEFALNRKDFDLTWNKTLAENKYLVGEKINVRGSFQLQPLNSLTPGNKHFIPVTSFTRGREMLKRGELTEAEFKKIYEVPGALKTAGGPAHAPRIAPPVEICGPQINIDFRDSFKWWVALGFLGLLGFFAAIIVGLYAKQVLIDLFPKYQEGGFLGNLSDFGVIVFTLLYSMAFWYVGWGH